LLTASCEKQLKDKLQRRNFARLCVFERMPGIFRVNGTGPVDRWCGRQVAAVRFCCNKNCILYDKRIYIYTLTGRRNGKRDGKNERLKKKRVRGEKYEKKEPWREIVYVGILI